jgi:type IV secretion system protein VirB6
MFSTVVGMANSLLAQLGDPNSATSIGSLVPFFVMVFLAKGFVAATPLVVRGISGNLMVVAAPAIAAGSAGVMRGVINTPGTQGRARIGALTTGEAVGRGAAQAPAVMRSAAASASMRMVRMVERTKRLGH